MTNFYKLIKTEIWRDVECQKKRKKNEIENKIIIKHFVRKRKKDRSSFVEHIADQGKVFYRYSKIIFQTQIFE